jgi:hypothetical protein
MTTFRLDDELLNGLRYVWERDGVQPSEQVRRAIRDWLHKQGVRMQKADRKRTPTRKRS